ncbi:MAG: flagellar basal-body rod protein FlgC [Firmicutes bacterium]|nr:flagellar basal-body rod protein FlgC [Bacillota bacterium]
MGIFNAIDAAASGMSAERLRMDVISNNIANANTSRTAEGGPYRRQMVVFEPRTKETGFAQMLATAQQQNAGRGVRVTAIVKDQSAPRMVYDPGHPDANKEGYREMPNINIVTEMVDMMTATRAYEANVTAVNAAKNMALKALEIGQ